MMMHIYDSYDAPTPIPLSSLSPPHSTMDATNTITSLTLICSFSIEATNCAQAPCLCVPPRSDGIRNRNGAMVNTSYWLLTSYEFIEQVFALHVRILTQRLGCSNRHQGHRKIMTWHPSLAQRASRYAMRSFAFFVPGTLEILSRADMHDRRLFSSTWKGCRPRCCCCCNILKLLQ